MVAAGGAKRALVYFGANAGPGVAKADYLAGVVAAARAAGLPAEGLAGARGAAPRSAARAERGYRAGAPDCQVARAMRRRLAPTASRSNSPRMRFLAAFDLDALINSAVCLAAAFALGTLIGAERQYRQRSAGLRTNALVAVGAAAFVDFGMRIGGPGLDPGDGLCGLRHRLSRRGRDHEGGRQRARPQHRGDALVLGRGRRRRRRAGLWPKRRC